MTPTNRFLFILLSFSWAVTAQTTQGTFNEQDAQEKGAYGVTGQMIDRTNDPSIQSAIKFYDTKKEVESVKKAVDAYKAADAASNASPLGIATSAAKDQLFKYKSSVTGTADFINTTLKRVQSVLDNAADRVNRWRTTLPLLKTYSEGAGDFLENGVEYLASFEISDLWDLDQKFFRGLEDRVKYGKGLAMSFAYFILSRRDGFGKFSHFLDAFYQTNRTPFFVFYDKQGLPAPEIKDLNNEDRIGMLALLEAKIGYDRLEGLAKGEYACDPTDPDLDCNCPEGATDCKPINRRALTMKKLVDGFNNPRLTTEDMDKLTEQLESRRLQIAMKRKVIQEIKARMASRYNDALAYRKAMEAMSQNNSCLSLKATIFDKDHSSDPKYMPNTCDDVAIFNRGQMYFVQPIN